MHFYTLSDGPNSKAIIYNGEEVRVLVSIHAHCCLRLYLNTDNNLIKLIESEEEIVIFDSLPVYTETLPRTTCIPIYTLDQNIQIYNQFIDKLVDNSFCVINNTSYTIFTHEKKRYIIKHQHYQRKASTLIFNGDIVQYDAFAFHIRSKQVYHSHILCIDDVDFHKLPNHWLYNMYVLAQSKIIFTPNSDTLPTIENYILPLFYYTTQSGKFILVLDENKKVELVINRRQHTDYILSIDANDNINIHIIGENEIGSRVVMPSIYMNLPEYKNDLVDGLLNPFVLTYDHIFADFSARCEVNCYAQFNDITLYVFIYRSRRFCLGITSTEDTINIFENTGSVNVKNTIHVYKLPVYSNCVNKSPVYSNCANKLEFIYCIDEITSAEMNKNKQRIVAELYRINYQTFTWMPLTVNVVKGEVSEKIIKKYPLNGIATKPAN